MFTFHKTYFYLTLLIFCVEVFIAVFVRDNFVRPYLGDILVVILIYCFLNSFLNLPVLKTALFVLLLAFSIEFLQYLKFIELLGLENSSFGGTILGTSFDWLDLLNYTIGIVILLLAEKYIIKNDLFETPN